jgi:hypothetical protein
MNDEQEAQAPARDTPAYPGVAAVRACAWVSFFGRSNDSCIRNVMKTLGFEPVSYPTSFLFLVPRPSVPVRRGRCTPTLRRLAAVAGSALVGRTDENRTVFAPIETTRTECRNPRFAAEIVGVVRPDRLLAMQKVEGSSPFIRSSKRACNRRFSVARSYGSNR